MSKRSPSWIQLFPLLTAAVFLLVFSSCGTIPKGAPVRAGKSGSGIEEFRVTGVQFEVREELFSDPAVLEAHLRKIITRIMEEHDPHFIVFPEYTGAFLVLSKYSDVFRLAAGIQEGLATIGQMEPEIQSLYDLFLRHAGEIAEQLDQMWGRLAKDFDVYILGGSYFHRGEGVGGGPVLLNRMAVYGPKGRRVYQQDKVFLTPFETTLLNLHPGEYPKEPGIVIRGVPVVFTICRDAFFDEWSAFNAGGYLWVDIKANGDVYDEETVSLFQRALPARIASSTVPYGLTVCLTGRLFELFWEGESFAVMKSGNGIKEIAVAGMWTGQTVLHLTIPFPRD